MARSQMDSMSPASFTINNPRTGTWLYSIADPAEAEIRRVVETARNAHEILRTMNVQNRIEEVGKLKAHILDHMEKIAAQVAQETGKTCTDALMLEVFQVVDTIAYYEKNAVKILADRIVKTPPMMMGKKSRIFYEPIGPVLVISPWNYPFNLTLIPALSAFLAGNSVIVKPSEVAPLKGLIEGIINSSGFPKEAIQVVYGGGYAAERLMDAGPAKVFFAGGVETGKKVLARAAQNLIPVDLELGGKDPMIVFEDVNIERTTDGALWAGMANCGQTCFAVERIYVQETAYEEFLRVLKEKAERLRTFDSPQPQEDPYEMDMGCMTVENQIAKVEELLADAVRKGARVLTGGVRKGRSRTFPPTIVADVNPTMQIQHEETFGPVVTVCKFRTEDEAVQLANDSVYGLAASVWSADLQRAERVARRIVAGNVSINNAMITAANPALPFGGVKRSGFGRYKGPFGLHTFSNIKSVVIDRQSPRPEGHWYPYTREKVELMLKMTRTFFGRGPFRVFKMLRLAKQFNSLLRRNRR